MSLLTKSAVRLGDIARSVAARSQRRRQRRVTVTKAAPVDVTGSARQLERAVSNLIDNAVKYSPDATSIDVVIEGSTLSDEDRGRGIAPEDRGRIFGRFYRAVDVRSDPGSGLGLSIVDEIVRRHGGTVFAGPREGGGSTVGFTLPHSPT